MILFPNCKINLGLAVLDKRKDGFHNLETVFYPLPLSDVLEIIPSAAANEPDALQFSASGLPVPGDPAANLCWKAYTMLKQDFPLLPSIQLHLHKIIPLGAGLGGGSADGAFTLRLLNELFHLQLSHRQLIHYAAKLGSDCPFFIINQPCLATSRGEVLEETALRLEDYRFVLAHPGIHVNTGWAFSRLAAQPRAGRPLPVHEAVLQPVEHWKEVLVNDFEKPVFEIYPAIARIKNRLYEQGALYASMSGSGSSVFGIFARTAKPDLTGFEGYTTYFL